MDKYIIDGQYGKYLEMIGVHVGEALKKAGVPEDLFSHRNPVLDESDYYCFMEAVGSQITDPKLPVLIASSDNIESFSPPIFAAYCSKNARGCIERLSRYKRIIAPMRYEITDCENTVILEISASRDELHMPQFLVEIEMVFLVHIIRVATKTDIAPLRVEMQEPADSLAFTGFMGCEAKKSESNYLIFRADDMEKPFVSYNESMWSFFEPELQKRLFEMDKDDSFSAKVKSALTELLPGDGGTIEDVAQKIGISKRTLQRKLSDEGTNFQKQLNGTRELLARHYIAKTDMSNDDIAFLLGYRELNSFLRAFGLWTGMSVGEYRRKFKLQR